MSTFFAVAPLLLLAEYVGGLVTLVGYVAWKVGTRRYLFSPYTIVVLTFAFTLFVAGPVSYNQEAWVVLSQHNVSSYYPFLNLSMAVNLGGFIVTLLVMWRTEARHTAIVSPPFFRRAPAVRTFDIGVLLAVGIALFAVCIYVAGSIPLFGDRTVFNSFASWRPVYNFANFLILFATSVAIVLSFTRRERTLVPLIAVGLLCMLATGGRTSLLSTVELIVMLAAYRRFRGAPGKATSVILAAVAVIGVLGLFLASFRAGGSFSLGQVATDALYGNTFSDIRDGAFVSGAWTTHTDASWLTGKTYAAGLLSFIPSSLSAFRTEWSWGYFTTETLFGYTGHYGFRGGWSLETYMNFGLAGVGVFAIACGWLLGRLESSFFAGIISAKGPEYSDAYAFGWLGYVVFTVLIASSATYNLYTLGAALTLLVVIRRTTGRARRRDFAALHGVAKSESLGDLTPAGRVTRSL